MDYLKDPIVKIQFQALKLAKGLTSGLYKSAFRGNGLEFEDLREYQAGDDLRALDWNQYAKTGQPYVRTYRDEREMTLLLAVDVSSSMRFGQPYREKNLYIAEICALLAVSAVLNVDKVALCLFNNDIKKFFSPAKGIRHAGRLIKEIVNFQESQETNLAKSFKRMCNLNQKRSICFVLSDFLDKNYEYELGRLSKMHDLIVIEVTDTLEEKLPGLGLTYLEDIETHNCRLIDLAHRQTNEVLCQTTQVKKNYIKKCSDKYGFELLSLKTNQLYFPLLYNLFKRRGYYRR